MEHVRLSVELLRALVGSPLTGQEVRVFCYVMLRTYGADGAAMAEIPNTDIAKALDIAPQRSCAVVGDLVERGILKETKKHGKRKLGINDTPKRWEGRQAPSARSDGEVESDSAQGERDHTATLAALPAKPFPGGADGQQTAKTLADASGSTPGPGAIANSPSVIVEKPAQGFLFAGVEPIPKKAGVTEVTLDQLEAFRLHWNGLVNEVGGALVPALPAARWTDARQTKGRAAIRAGLARDFTYIEEEVRGERFYRKGGTHGTWKPDIDWLFRSWRSLIERSASAVRPAPAEDGGFVALGGKSA